MSDIKTKIRNMGRYQVLQGLKKAGKKGGIWTFTLGAMALVGFLSFTEFYEAYPIFGAAIVSLIFAAGVEGEVYRQNISGAFKKIFSNDYVRRQTILNYFNQCIQKQTFAPGFLQNNFIIEYRNAKINAKKFSKLAHKYKLNDEEKNAYQKAKNRLTFLENYLCDFVTTKPRIERDRNHFLLDGDLEQLLTEEKLTSLRKRIKVKNILKWTGVGVSCFVTVASLLNSAFTTTAAINSITTTFAIVAGAVAISATAWPVAVIACIGFGLMIYNTIIEVITDDHVKEWLKKFFNKYKRKTLENGELESRARQVGRIISHSIALTFLVGLSLFATVASWGTWFGAIGGGARLIPFIEKVSNYISGVLIPGIGISVLVFNLRNAFESVRTIIPMLANLAKIIRNNTPWQLIKRIVNHVIISKIEKLRAKGENNWQIFNPFRILYAIIAKSVKLICVPGHAIAMGITSDKLFQANPSKTEKVTAGSLSAGFEFLSDLHYFTEKDHDEGGHAGHDHSNDLITRFCKYIAFSWLLTLGAFWDAAFAKPQPGEAVQPYKHRLKNAFRKLFHHEKKKENPEMPELEAAAEPLYEKAEVIHDLDEAVKHYKNPKENTAKNEKKQMFQTALTQLTNNPDEEKVILVNPVIAHKRHPVFSDSKTWAEKQAQKINEHDRFIALSR